MGIGMVIVVPAAQVEGILTDLSDMGEKAYVIGKVEEGNSQVEYRTGEV